MSDKKRKAESVDSERPAKKTASLSAVSSVQVTFVSVPDIAKPVVAAAPGLSLPIDLQFTSFSKTNTNGQSELLLHSSSHPSIDYTATEGTDTSDKFLKHYVAVLDPATGQLHVTEAKMMTVRSRVRRRDPAADSDEESAENNPISNYSSRAALVHAFGTKKSKKAVLSQAENRLLARGVQDADDPLSNAILSSIPAPGPAEDATDLARASMPLPTANLATDIITDVYPLTSLIFPQPVEYVLKEMPVGYWRETISKRKPVKCGSRYVANRIEYLVKALLKSPDDAQALERVQTLRYILLLFEIWYFIRGIKHQKRLMPMLKLQTQISGNIPVELVSKIVERYSPDGMGLSQHGALLLQSTILALTLHIPPPGIKLGDQNSLVTEPTDIQLDLAMKPEQTRKMYRELGCKMVSGTDANLKRWGLVKKQADTEGDPSLPKPKFAKLEFPIEFPVQSLGRSTHGRR